VADPACSSGDRTKADDLLVLGGEPGQGVDAEVGEFVGRLLRQSWV
jgi:hypothetical protein